jgi:hypothetical protein
MHVSRTCGRHACTILLGGLSEVQEGREAPTAALLHLPSASATRAERPVPEQSEHVWVELSHYLTPSRKSGTASSVLRAPP